MRPKSGAASAVPVERHDDFGGELPRDGHIGETRVHRRRRILPPWSIETELNKRQKLVEGLVLRRPAGKASGQVMLKRPRRANALYARGTSACPAKQGTPAAIFDILRGLWQPTE